MRICWRFSRVLQKAAAMFHVASSAVTPCRDTDSQTINVREGGLLWIGIRLAMRAPKTRSVTYPFRKSTQPQEQLTAFRQGEIFRETESPHGMS
jgi:hypothetical protein